MSESGTRRLAALDVARGVALAAMAVYHFAWDLEFFGFAEPGMTAQLPWKLFARSIATSFLFLAGVSFLLAHGRGFSFGKFWPRFAQIAGAALAISIATRLAMPDSFIFFGILHEIAAASLIGIFAVRLPALPILALALMAFLLPQLFTDAAFNTRWLAWTGFAETAPRSNDLVTFFPWTAAFLGGLGITKAASGILQKLANQVPAWLKPAEWAGKHSLIIYLVHQPVLIGLVWASAQVFPRPIRRRNRGLRRHAGNRARRAGITCFAKTIAAACLIGSAFRACWSRFWREAGTNRSPSRWTMLFRPAL